MLAAATNEGDVAQVHRQKHTHPAGSAQCASKSVAGCASVGLVVILVVVVVGATSEQDSDEEDEVDDEDDEDEDDEDDDDDETDEASEDESAATAVAGKLAEPLAAAIGGLIGAALPVPGVVTMVDEEPQSEVAVPWPESDEPHESNW